MTEAMNDKGAAEIPVIDISPSNKNAAHDILDAAIRFGFVYVENNEAAGMPPASVERMFDLSKEFFQSPTENKESCSVNSKTSGKNQGWLSMHTETLDPGNQKRGDFKEAFNMGEIRNGQINQPLPPPLSLNTPTLTTFASQCHNLCTRILQLFALGLEIPESWFSNHHDQSKGPSGSILRLLYYPRIVSDAPNADDIRAGAHSDYGSVTLLFQLPGQPGLEILTAEGTWASVPVDPSCTTTAPASSSSKRALPILVNIGDLLAYWTDGLLRSTVHRVVFPRGGGEDRYSIAYFCHPLDDARLVPVPSKMVEGYRGGVVGMKKNEGALTARDHLDERLAATYGIKT